MEPNSESYHDIIEALVKAQKRIQSQIAVNDEAERLYDPAWSSIWTGLREMAENCRPGLDGVLFTIRGGFNLCDDFLRSGCKRLALQAMNMTLAYTMPDDLQHKMESVLAAGEVKIPDMNLGTGKIQIRKEKP